MALIKQIYKPSMNAGQFYARPYGSTGPRVPVGNVLEAVLSHEEDVKRMADMTRTGGGTYAKVSRISAVKLALKMADWNPVNFTRAVFGTVATVAGAAVVDEVQVANKGGLIRLAHPQPTLVTVVKGVTPVTADNYEVRPEGIYILPEAAGVTDLDSLKISYTHPEHVNVEALTSAAPELELSFGGLNEADSGKPVLLDVYRVASSIVKELALVQSNFGELDIESEVLIDPTKSGTGISRFYRVQMV